FQRTKSRLASTAASSGIIGRCSRPRITFTVQNLLAIERHSEVVDVFDELIHFALAEIKLLNSLRNIWLIVFGDDQWCFRKEQDSRLPAEQIEIILPGNRQRENQLPDIVDVDLHDDSFVLLFVL